MHTDDHHEEYGDYELSEIKTFNLSIQMKYSFMKTIVPSSGETNTNSSLKEATLFFF
jgi:hypothetical protein